jgi:single-strand DNA-binding protein
MVNLNRVLLIGNLTRDPEARYTPKGTAVAEISVAVNRTYSGEDGEKKEEATFIDVTLWGRQAEVAQEYLRKGRSVFIEGRLQLDSWEDKQTGKKRSRLRVVAENMQMLDSGNRPTATNQQPPSGATRQPARTREPEPALDAEPDDIPFG